MIVEPLSRSIPAAKYLLIVFILFATTPIAIAGQTWKSVVKDAVNNLVIEVDRHKTIYIDSPVDATREASYYPFLSTVHDVMSSAVLGRSINIDPEGLSSDYFFSTKFRIAGHGLELTLSLVEANSDTVVATDILELTPEILPKGWNLRTLRDIGYELVTKLKMGKFRFRSNVPVVVEEFVGGSTDNELYISEFAIALRGYIRAELSQSQTFRLLTNTQAHDHDISPYRLKGRYQVDASSISTRLVLLESETTTEIANVSSRFLRRLVPSSLSVSPPNIEVAAETKDIDDYETQTIDLRIGVNHENLNYKHGDKLIVSMLPTVDLYARVYYVDSKGEACQIFPLGGGDGFLSGRKIRMIGNSHLNLTIDTSETWGQESIKAFTSSAPIDDSAVPKEKGGGCMKNYNAVSRGIRLESTVQLATEIMILVEEPE